MGEELEFRTMLDLGVSRQRQESTSKALGSQVWEQQSIEAQAHSTHRNQRESSRVAPPLDGWRFAGATAVAGELSSRSVGGRALAWEVVSSLGDPWPGWEVVSS